MKKNELNQEYWTESTHTVLSYWFCVIAVGTQLVLGLTHINELFGQMCLVEALLGFSSLFLLDLLHTGRMTIYPKPFKKVHPNTFFRFVIAFGVIISIQFLFQIIPLITTVERALGVVMCAPIEEYFFRGVLMEPCFRAGEKSKDKFIVWRYEDKIDKEMSYIELGGILLSSCIFASFHVNYYNDTRLLLMVFIGGIWLSILYFWNKDLTSIILAHFALNIAFVVQFWMIYGL